MDYNQEIFSTLFNLAKQNFEKLQVEFPELIKSDDAIKVI